MSFLDTQWNEEVDKALRNPPGWNSDLIQDIHSLSGASLVAAIKIGKRLDFDLRSKGIPLTDDGLFRVGVPFEDAYTAMMCVELVMHDPGCEERTLYRDRRRYGTREGEQAIIDKIVQLFAAGKSYRRIAETLNLEGYLPRKGKWTHSMVKNVIDAGQNVTPSHPCKCRMYRTDWEKPSSPSVCIEVLRLSDDTFEAMRTKGGTHRDTTENDVRRFRRSLAAQADYTPPLVVDHSNIPHLNQVVFGDCRKRIEELPDNSVSLVVTSPPYGEQRSQYKGATDADYPEFTLEWMTPMKQALKNDGSVMIIIRPHVKDGQETDYVERTITALKGAGWILIQRSIWYKPDGGPFGAVDRPRRNYEYVLWFAKTTKPYVNLTADGKNSDRIGMLTKNPQGNFHSTGGGFVDGIARVSDVIIAPVSGCDKGVNHPAMCPPDLIRQLILPYAPEGGLVVDPFAGAGTTCLVAQSLGRDSIGFENGYEELGKDRDGKPIHGDSFADIANRRLATEVKYKRGAALVKTMAKGVGA
jgi:site-specific DNA-methyltransferase (adenine-specific)/site-specific DNA-methyltransferase (cytosine-N4-specific)